MKELTVAEEAMQLVASQERQPAYTVALVLPQLDADVDRDLVLGNLATVQQLHQELALEIAFGQQLGREPWRIGKTGLRRLRLERRLKIFEFKERTQRTSSGTSLTRVAKVRVARKRMSSSGSLMRPSTGTTRKIT